MASGTDAYNGALTKATATNHENGVITVYNAGAGMAAYGNTNTVINGEPSTRRKMKITTILSV